ncbi:hypothetical protein KpP1_073 [Klebsiella phage P1]|uniref:Uncharacterized protein n=1 Tax=Klebsiella phage P1 TaxID=2862735 RepID=A0AC61NDJ7_9CAUD|nr:hypothetical protein KpP1_073 [Klebsiella phage P1]
MSKKMIALYWVLFLGGLALHDSAGWQTIGMLCMIIGVCRLSEINGFRRGRRAAFTGDKE